MLPAPFLAVLDRDGVINKHDGYVYRIEDFRWNEGIFELLENLQEMGAAIYVATNQAGIGRGTFTHEDFWGLTNYMLDELSSRGLEVSGVLYCPHESRPNGQPNCLCRKPQSGLLRQALQLSNLAASSAIMIGDKASDMLAAKNAGFQRRILLSTEPAEIEQMQHTEVYDSIRRLHGRL